ncbi:MAG TPA: GNAT family N-acetyltransferase [Polyangiaceae bacterium]|nr:GNAT family N-acetyltransferase [Polyangiaceae bacterium]
MAGEQMIKTWPVDVATGVARRAWRRAKVVGPLVREPRIAALKYTGPILGGLGRAMTMLYVGEAERAHEFELFVGADANHDVPAPKELFRGSIASYMLQRARIDRMASTVDVSLRQLFPLEKPAADGLLYRPFVDGHLEVARDLTQQLRRVRSRSYRRLLRGQLRRSGWSAEVHTDAPALATFWRELHEPYVRARFGKRVVLDTLDQMSAQFGNGGRVLFVKEGDRVVAGTVLFHDFGGQGVLTYHRNGMRDPASTALVAERTTMLELSLLRYAIDNRFRRIDLGFTRAIANDGRFVHKRRLGCTFEPVVGAPTLVVHCAPALAPAFFARYSLLTGEPRALTMHLGLDGSTPRPRPQLYRGALKGYLAPGVTTLHVHTSKAIEAAEREPYEKATREVAGDRDVLFDEA